MRSHVRIPRSIVLVSAATAATLAFTLSRSLWTGKEGDTYALSAFRIVFPYDSARSDVSPSHDAAAVTFTTRWPDTGFPGGAKCRLSLSGSGGEEVGTLHFQLISGTDGTTSRPMLVPVSGRPISAEGSCQDDPDETSIGSGYLFTGPTSITTSANSITGEVIPGLSEVVFDVRWERPGQNPGMRTCFLVVTRTDGTHDAPLEYGMLVGEGALTFDVKGAPDTVADARATCGPFAG
jgi:hypothetical protein